MTMTIPPRTHGIEAAPSSALGPIPFPRLVRVEWAKAPIPAPPLAPRARALRAGYLARPRPTSFVILRALPTCALGRRSPAVVATLDPGDYQRASSHVTQNATMRAHAKLAAVVLGVARRSSALVTAPPRLASGYGPSRRRT